MKPRTGGAGRARKNPLLRLNAKDNVLTVIRPLLPGEQIRLGRRRVSVARAIALGHKIAAWEIPPGAKIIKYGVPIGSAAVLIRAGEHVHTHNLQSDYIATFDHQTQKEFFKAHH